MVSINNSKMAVIVTGSDQDICKDNLCLLTNINRLITHKILYNMVQITTLATQQYSYYSFCFKNNSQVRLLLLFFLLLNTNISICQVNIKVTNSNKSKYYGIETFSKPYRAKGSPYLNETQFCDALIVLVNGDMFRAPFCYNLYEQSSSYCIKYKGKLKQLLINENKIEKILIYYAKDTIQLINNNKTIRLNNVLYSEVVHDGNIKYYIDRSSDVKELAIDGIYDEFQTKEHHKLLYKNTLYKIKNKRQLFKAFNIKARDFQKSNKYMNYKASPKDFILKFITWYEQLIQKDTLL